MLTSLTADAISGGPWETPASLEGALAKIASASSALEKLEADLRQLCAGAVPEAGWACKHFYARWQQRYTTSWKLAVNTLIAGADLSDYKTIIETVSIRPATDTQIAARALHLMMLIQPILSKASANILVCGLILVTEALQQLSDAKDILRSELLTKIGEGYTVSITKVRKYSRKVTRYQDAVRDKLGDVSVGAFSTVNQSVTAARRVESDAALIFA